MHTHPERLLAPQTLPEPIVEAPPSHLLYLHGFRSSPQSFKARRLAAWVAEHRPDLHWWCPQLPPSPRAAIESLLAGVAAWPAGRSVVLGSSLGGFYAGVLAERLGWPAVLLNPAVEPARDLAKYIGEQSSWHDPAERFFFQPAYVDELRALAPPARLSRPETVFAVIAQGDEVLDAAEMRTRCTGAQVRWLPGGDHALSDFDAHLPALLHALRLDT